MGSLSRAETRCSFRGAGRPSRRVPERPPPAGSRSAAALRPRPHRSPYQRLAKQRACFVSGLWAVWTGPETPDGEASRTKISLLNTLIVNP